MYARHVAPQAIRRLEARLAALEVSSPTAAQVPLLQLQQQQQHDRFGGAPSQAPDAETHLHRGWLRWGLFGGRVPNGPTYEAEADRRFLAELALRFRPLAAVPVGVCSGGCGLEISCGVGFACSILVTARAKIPAGQHRTKFGSSYVDVENSGADLTRCRRSRPLSEGSRQFPDDDGWFGGEPGQIQAKLVSLGANSATLKRSSSIRGKFANV